MNYARTHPRAAVLGVGVAFALAAPLWVGAGHDGKGRMLFALALEAVPFLALAAASDEMPWWVAIAAAGVFGAFTDSSVKDITDSTSSTAVIAIPLVPL